MSEPAVEYEPDPRNEPDYWTARKLVEEDRPPARKDGSGGRRRLWAVCQSCRLERSVDLETVASLGHADQTIDTLRLRCKCGGHGHALLRWVNVPKVHQDTPGGLRREGKPRPGHYDFATGERRGAWD